MKHSIIFLLSVLATLLAPSITQAQTPPGWGWVQKLGTYVPNATTDNDVAGLGRDAAGNLYLLGTYAGQSPVIGAPNGSLGGSDIFLAKYDPAGTLLWQRILTSSGNDGAAAPVVEPNGRCTLAGYYGHVTGDNLSLASFGSNTPPLAGAAFWGLPAPGGMYQSLAFVAAVDANGALLWADTPSPTYGPVVTGLHRDGAGNCYVSANTQPQGQLRVNGQSYPPIGSTDAVLLKYTAGGQVAWVRREGVVGGNARSAVVQTDNADAVYWLLAHSGPITVDQVTVGAPPTTTLSNATNSLVKLSASNRVKWIRNNLLRVGTANALTQVLAFDAASNALYVSGYTTGGAITYPGGASPVPVMANAVTTCVARCDTAGQVQWVKPVFYATNVPGGLPGPRASGINEFKAQGTGFTLVTRTVDFNATTFYGSTRTFGLSEGGLPCVAQFNTTTNQPDWVRTGGTPSALGQNPYSDARRAAIDAAGNVYLAGTFAGTARFGATSISSASTIQPEIFLAKLDQSIIAGTKPGASGQPWSVFPNPATSAVQLTGLPPQAHVRVHDALGRLVRELVVIGTASTVSGLTPGLYLLQVTHTATPYRSQRLVVQ